MPVTTEPAPTETTALLTQLNEEVLLHQVDTLDDQIIALVAHRAALVNEIQRDRTAAGGPGTRLSRETQVIARYSNSLGRPGVELALLLLNLCRYRGRGSAAAAQAARHS
ncbi:chorismate mutase [Streptomyces sp. NBC_00091]|uniref:chorismate mutase n=1 Tax=Streptomyces sp. NBC_00091 TaxID=2975648 RepID=UPI002255E297|nr:chorismate mutase [Streptomyces sp. NBC_00091]MCX5380977.1 chorismate mutase [Streptomyces sp. NBC_00091]